MRTICLVMAAILWALHAVGVHGDRFSLVWLGAALIVRACATADGWPKWGRLPP